MSTRALAPLAAVILLAGCVSAADQQQMDAQRCYGFGFPPNTPSFANCMMQTSQQRQAEQAAAARQSSYNDMVAKQAQADRDAQAARDAAAASAAHSAEVQSLMAHPTQTVAPGMDIPKVEVPQVPMPDMSGMHCTGSSGANAGSMNCSN